MTEKEVGYVLLVRVTPAATVAAAAYPPSLACLCSHLMVQGGVVGLPCRCAHLAVLTSLCSPRCAHLPTVILVTLASAGGGGLYGHSIV